ncbi:NGG1p interacting factor 3, NIF3 [Metarhizium rileyi]|uniref:ATP phosphoribosyltransferase n=1 Tax=Metarhizium rileyi (strain RCEF 4871) TaxID=1649241 RepID=A0A162JKK8_METRR|nr:NGG1p interacting factor 3, NIF3 [Metarhizium rileyi RCEF 4871]
MSTTFTAVAVFTLVFYVPESHVAACKSAIFAAGAGRFPNSNYTESCWTTIGTGQFRPGAGAKPHIGSIDELELVPEVRVETQCVGEDVCRKVVVALKAEGMLKFKMPAKQCASPT